MMNSSVIKTEQINLQKAHFCVKCDKQIQDRYFLKALNAFWHEDCLKCNCCDCRLADVGSTLFTRENVILCKSDYIRLYGNTGHCSACNKLIPAFEMVMRAKRNVYHLECFACQQCSHRFCVGDRFYLCDNKILCENDYADRQLQMEMNQQNQQNVTTTTTSNNNNNNSEFSINRNSMNKSQTSGSANMTPLYSEKNNFTNFDVPIHVR
ncbi:LIM domain only protein 3-like [Contarinia nasturtii]|uniref:LIM domain only protein 3-like n=1 Tax=Contarinia nasturtii TaxID=265458 RepID=UPI0012D43670|nr:LIM domain only protein 3-like [Contarinia nasturtii]